MKHLRYLLMAALVALPLTACDEDSDGGTPVTPVTPTPAVGTVTGQVSVEGAGLAGVNVTLVGATSQSVTTGSGGSYTFANVQEGSYGVTISNTPADVVFGSTAKTTAITQDGQSVTVNFDGQYIRTSSIAGQVLAGGAGLAGVAVTLSGPGTASAVTDNGGNFNFSGLRAGTYTVTISNIPTGYTFQVLSNQVTVGTGEAKIVTFVGTMDQPPVDPVSATVVIKSVTRLGTLFPVNPTNVVGQIDVTLAIDPGGNDLNSISLLLNGNTVATQTLTTPGAADNVQMVDGIFEVVFSIMTAAFNPVTGAVSYPNGNYVLSAVLGLDNADQASVTTSMNLVFNNLDTFTGSVVPTRSAIGANGLLYYGGALTVTVIPVTYSGLTVSSVTTTFFANGANVAITDAAAPFVIAYGNAAGQPLNAYQTATAFVGAETMRVSAALYSNGTVFDALGLVLPVFLPGGLTMTIDNVAPPVIGPDNVAGTADDLVLALPNQVTDANHPICCSNNWLHNEFLFAGADRSTANATTRDNTGLNSGGPGVGGVVTTYHFDLATLTQAQVAATAAATKPSDRGFNPSQVNTTYELVMVLVDALGNTRTVGLSASADNPLATTVGLDAAAPTAQAAADPDGAGPNVLLQNKIIMNAASAITNPAALKGFTVGATEDRAGFSATPFRMWLRRITAANTRYPVGASFTAGGVVNEASVLLECNGAAPANGAPCLPDKDAAAPTNPDAYYTVWGNLVDQAGNPFPTAIQYDWLLDVTLPTTNNISIPSSNLVGGALTNFAYQVQDNLDLWETYLGFDFANAGIYIPLGENVTVGDGDRWDGNVVTTAAGAFQVPFVRALELTTGANAPVGVVNATTNVRAITEDAAGNLSVPAFNNFIPATVPAGGSFVPGGMATIAVTAPSAAVNLCNGQGTAACPNTAAGRPSTTLTVQVTGPSGTYANPFAGARVYFYFIIDPVAGYYNNATEQYFLVGWVDGNSATFTDTGAVRTYSFSFTLTKDMVASVPAATVIQIAAIGTDSTGDAILTQYNGNITVVNGA